MSLELVSLTGADDHVAPEALAALSAQYLFAEWAILYFPEKEGTPRNPSGVWREKLLALNLPHTAAHLCGAQVFRELLNPDTAPAVIADLLRYRRIQLNINAGRPEFSDEEVLAIYRKLLDAGLHLILQYHDASRRVIKMFVAEAVPESLSRIGLLYDASKGTGQRPEFWPPMSTVGSAPLFCGYAGGLGPDVLEEELPRIREAATARHDLPFWIDMESGIRTDGEFDLSKAESVLRIASGRKQSLGRIDHILSVEQQRKAATPASVFLVTGTRYGYKEDTTWTLTSWPTKEAAEAHVAFLEAKLQEAADQVAEGCTNGLDYPDREKIEALMVEYDKQLELGANGAGWSIEEVVLRTDFLAFSVKEPV